MHKQSGRVQNNHEEQVRKTLAEIENLKKEFEKKRVQYVVLDEEQLRKKLSRAKSPMIIAQGWSSAAAPGGTITYSVYIKNPDPGPWVWVFAHVFVGPANFVVPPAEAVEAVDGRFPRLTMPEFPGLSIAANDTSSLTFNVAVPAAIEPSNYQGNTFLYQADWHDVGDYLDRGTFVFKVT